MKGYIYIIYICHHGYSYQSQALPPSMGIGVGWLGLREENWHFLFIFPLPSKGCHWGRVGYAFGGLGSLGWLAMEGNDGIKKCNLDSKNHMKSHDTSCGLGIGAGFPGFLDFLSPVAGREMRWGNGYIIRELVNHAWSGDADFLLWWDVRRISTNGPTAFPTIIIVVYQIRELEWLGWLRMRMEWCILSWDGKGLHGFIGSGWKAGFGFWCFHGWCSCITAVYIYRYGMIYPLVN